jgi:hypothetical protein
VIGLFDGVINGDTVGIPTGALGMLVCIFLGAETGDTGALLGDGADCTEGNCELTSLGFAEGLDGLVCEGAALGARTVGGDGPFRAEFGAMLE